MCVCAAAGFSSWSSERGGIEYLRGRIPLVRFFKRSVARILDCLRFSGSSYRLDGYVRDFNACLEHDQMKFMFERRQPSGYYICRQVYH